jgi:N-acetylglutamate synthase-like GNAT family acetyltransferase
MNIINKTNLTECDGKTPDKEWISAFINNSKCIALGFFTTELIGVILAEKLLFDGIMIRFLAIDPDHQHNGYGELLLNAFEAKVKDKNISWIYLVSTNESCEFYNKNGYISNKSKTFEFVKELY